MAQKPTHGHHYTSNRRETVQQSVDAVAVLLPAGRWFGFVPPLLFVFLAATTMAYLLPAQGVKALFFRRFARSATGPT